VQEGEETADATVCASIDRKGELYGDKDRKNELHTNSNTDTVVCGR
jgi:hypothetical protein